jgi:hypothetical protein
MATVSNIVILSRTKMAGDKICVGGYCCTNDKYVRLLSEKAQALHSDEPYEIGDIYRIKYAPLYANRIEPPHIEDIVIYEQRFIETLDKDVFMDKYINELSIECDHIKNLFEEKLHWTNSKGYLLESDIPSSSVVIARLSHTLEKKKDEDSFFYIDRSIKFFPQTYAVKYVGEEEYSGNIVLPAGTAIRFSLARWWDMKGNGEYRSYLQLSGFYV